MTAQTNRQNLRSIEQHHAITTTLRPDRAARFWNMIAKRYAAKPVVDEDAYAHKLKITREHLHSEAIVLEFGCGTGSTALAHAPYAKHIRATDVSARMIEIARNKAADASIGNVDFVCDGIGDVEAANASLDVVMMHSLLHLLEDWRLHITQAYRVLKPGGVLISSTMCLQDDVAFLRILAPIGRTVGVLPRLSFFTRNELEQAMADAGFEISYAWQPAPKTGVFLVARKLS